jgi:PEGA domain
MHKIFSNIAKLFLISSFTSSCAFFNSTKVTLPIASNPPGANVYIDGAYFGKTPTILNLEPSKDYQATLTKEGYGSSTVNLETWASVRGGRGADTTRCVLDAMGAMLIIPLASFLSVHCRDFKQEQYMVNIQNSGGYSAKPPVSLAPTRNSPESIQRYNNPPMNDYKAYGNSPD